METTVTNDRWILTLCGTPASTIKPSSVDFHYSLKNSHQHFPKVAIEYPQNPTFFNQISRYVIEDPILLEAVIIKGIVHLGIDTSLWSDIVCRILCFVHELLDNYGAASKLAIELELLDEHNTLREDETCAICLDDLRAQVRLTRTPCEHVFHDSCLRSWLRINNSCPLCRRQVGIDVDDDHDFFQIISNDLQIDDLYQIDDFQIDDDYDFFQMDDDVFQIDLLRNTGMPFVIFP